MRTTLDAQSLRDMRARAERTLQTFSNVKAPWNERELARHVVALLDELDAVNVRVGGLVRVAEAARRLGISFSDDGRRFSVAAHVNDYRELVAALDALDSAEAPRMKDQS